MSLQKSWQATDTILQHGIHDTSLEKHLAETSQGHLFQAQVLRDCLAHLKEQGLVEAYLRGSFANGEADEHSDIDLFLVVDPEKLEEIHTAFTEHLAEKYAILVSCHDKLVKDYGGIGFMYLCGDANKKMFQFDLYMAMKGVAPRAQLFNSPRIHSTDPTYCWNQEYKCSPMPEVADNFIKKFSAGESKADKMEYLCNDLMVTLSIMKKHVTRGQIARALNDNNHATGVCIEMLRTEFADPSVHSSLYAGDKMIQAAKESGNSVLKSLAEFLEEQFVSPVSLRKVNEMFFIGTALLHETCPEAYKNIEQSIDAYNSLVVGAGDMDDAVLKASRKPANDLGPKPV
jgi:predicted nucleotidyltransferase